ncbi:MAG TPA: UDP-N-acetylmuramoyl-L-alanine--D-glutamate ligase, partial [Blastocatellia bacterium]|nr:UDP-N-acetylmuramoyl-L-alanine--D-glutamate ligase [Blastocatellia bacterium]
GVKVVSEVELAAWFVRGQWIGITGSNGKTTTTTLAGDLMRAVGGDVLVAGNIGTPLTSVAQMSGDDKWIVAELSSFQLETVESLRLRVAVVTNLTPDHLDRHGSMESYARAKHRIFMNQTAKDWSVLNGDDKEMVDRFIYYGIPSRTVYFSSRGPEAACGKEASVYVRDRSVYTTLVADDQSEAEVIRLDEIPLRGSHNVENVMAALAAAICASGARVKDLPHLGEAIKRFKGVEHRLEFVADLDGVTFYNDSKATNVDSTIKAIESFEQNIILILGGSDKGTDFDKLVGPVSGRVKQVIVIGETSEKIAAQLEGAAPIVRARGMDDAVLRSIEAAQAGDTVLLAPACASFDMFDNYEHRGRAFKESVYKLANRLHSGWTGRLTI